MKKVELLNLKGEKVKDINLNENVFGIEPNKNVLYDAIILARASLRQGTHSTKNRSEVSGGGRKPWRQKGTGRARQGSIRAVQWVGGGRYGTPVPRDYSKKQNRKERRLAIKSALAEKAEEKARIKQEKKARKQREKERRKQQPSAVNQRRMNFEERKKITSQSAESSESDEEQNQSSKNMQSEAADTDKEK